MYPLHFRPERMKGQTGDLEKLFAERNAHDRDAKKHSENKIAERKFRSSENKPQYIQKERDRACIIVPHFLSKRIQGDAAEFEALQPYGNTDDRNTPDAACDHPAKRAEQSSEYDP